MFRFRLSLTLAFFLITAINLILNLSLFPDSHVYAFTLYDDTNCQTHIAQSGGPCEDVKNTRHNLSSSFDPALGTRNVFTALTTEICVFCHTPHGANTDALPFGAPIWNRKLSEATYTLYDQVWSKSFEAYQILGRTSPGAPTGFSRLCLSCHDGTIALGRLINPPGSGGFVAPTSGGDPGTFSFSMSTTPTETIPAGAGVATGDTRLLDVDLRNDHAISFIFDNSLALEDGELVDPGSPITLHQVGSVSLTQTNIDPNLSPLKRHVGESPTAGGPTVADSVQCTSCHNPHQVDFPKFLRANRLQLDQGPPYDDLGADPMKKISTGCPPSCNPPTGSPPMTAEALPRGAIICLFCHDKPGVPYGGVSLSTHFTDPTRINLTTSTRLTTDLMFTTAQPLSSVINQTPATVTVAQRACLACHDPHTEQGAIRLLRQGADSNSDVAIEHTCYQCHSPTNYSFNTIDTTDCSNQAVAEDKSASFDKPDCPPDILTQFQKDAGTSGEADDPPFFPAPADLTGSLWGASPPTTTGSAMNLRLGLGHQPVFTDKPREGVQMNTDNFIPSIFGGIGGPSSAPLSPAGFNKIDTIPPGGADTKHIECVDCHNMHRVDRTNRFRGMPGITIGTGAFGTVLDTTGRPYIVAQTLDTWDVNREPYIFEVCLRCHGNSFNNHVREKTIIANGTGLTVQFRGNNPVPSFAYGQTPSPSNNLGGGSNKRKEFDPNATPTYDINSATNALSADPRLVTQAPNYNNGLPGLNTSFHPVAAPGRNQSGVLNNCGTFTVVGTEGRCSGGGQLLGQLSRKNTIHCTDCHNSDIFGTYVNGLSQPNNSNANVGSISFPDFPGPITFDETRGTAHKRGPVAVFAWAPDYEGDLGQNPNIPITPSGTLASLNNPNTPQGPHGSQWRRILRSNYATLLGADEADKPGTGYNSRDFALCFNCHNEAAFITESWATASNRLTNFYRGDNPSNTAGGQTGNLHRLHLVDNMSKTKCHECHYNVHSNIESGNTLYVNLPGLEPVNPGHASSTHLINFAPEVNNLSYSNPIWGNGPNINNGNNGSKDDSGHDGPGCNLRCHGQDMEHNYDAHSVVGGGKCTEPNGCSQ